MEIQCLFASIFNCENKTENLSKATHLRIQSIMVASNQRKDHIHKILAEKLSRNAEVVFHKSCVSTYTSKHHISHILGKRINTARSKSEPPPPKRRSQSTTFSFKEHCLFCGDICLSRDPKHPNHWREVCRCKTADPAPGRKSTKEQILEKFNERGDNLADQVHIRVIGAAADLHAADGQYHKDCFQSFMRKGK